MEKESPKSHEPSNYLTESMKKSFEYWSGIDEDSLINCLPVWKTFLKNNPQILKNQYVLIDNVKQDPQNHVQQFLELWSHAIEEPNFEQARKSMQKWQGFWEKTSDDNIKIFTRVLDKLETFWKDMQNKNIE